ncbi:hypothetical protein [[Phormidium] sp. ETS-05]|uniref:hypothetical protein n=1 Tax=[Phormidium] sp. ETS-05 TaxID=222819 RepID=UPI0018EEDDC1|nr:hypothetical protein [[Phormidium] sp. ETS-05]
MARPEAPDSFGDSYWVGGKYSLGAPPGDAEGEDFYPLMAVMGWVVTHSSIGDEICPQTETGAGFVKY